MFRRLKEKFRELRKRLHEKGEIVEEKVEVKEKSEKRETEKIEKEKGEDKKEKTKIKTEDLEEKKEEPQTTQKEVRKKKSIFRRTISEKTFNQVFDELELEFLELNVALEVIERIRQELKEKIVGKAIKGEEIKETLKEALEKILCLPQIDILKIEKKPFIIAFFGVNGAGKTTTIAKIAKYLIDNGKKVVLAASDTYRAASIEQLCHHAEKLGIKVIKHDYGADPAAVAYDAIEHARARNIDYVLIDTAGRLHSNKNLIEELKKIVRVTKPDLKILVAEAITGNDAVIQAETFQREIGIDGIILTKMDIDEKGGTAISMAYTTKKPIMFIGTGQEYKDLKRFNCKEIIENIFEE